ncbi:hypothetical protein ID1000_14480 [Helicobacter pylori]
MKFFKIPKPHLNSKEHQEMFLESFIVLFLFFKKLSPYNQAL